MNVEAEEDSDRYVESNTLFLFVGNAFFILVSPEDCDEVATKLSSTELCGGHRKSRTKTKCNQFSSFKHFCKDNNQALDPLGISSLCVETLITSPNVFKQLHK